MIHKIHKNNRNKTDTCLGEGVGGRGYTFMTGSHIGAIHISLGICVRGYTYHEDTHITLNFGYEAGIGEENGGSVSARP